MMISGEKNRMKDNIKLSLIYPSIKDDSLESKVDVVKTVTAPTNNVSEVNKDINVSENNEDIFAGLDFGFGDE